jgi:hypothetical protein
MAHTSGSGRPVHLGLALTSLTLMVAGCASIVPQDLQVPKFYFKDYSLNVTARHIQGKADLTFETQRRNQLIGLRNVGLLYSPNYVFVADPVFLLQKTEPVTLPPADLVEETVIVNGKEEVQKVLRKPIFYIDRATVTYQVAGYDIPAATYELQLPVKSNDYRLTLPALSQVGPLMTTFSRDAAAAGSVSGTLTVSVDMRDLDPLASNRTFKVTRTLPLVYSYTASRPEDAQAGQASPAAPATVAPTIAPTAEPTATASPSPSPTPTATPIVP